MDVEHWLSSSQAGGYHRRQVSAMTISGPWSKNAKQAWWNINWWSVFAHVVTFWAPAPLLKMVGYHDKQVRQAFREKFALCFIVFIMCVALAIFTFGLGPILCPSNSNTSRIIWREFEKQDKQGLTWALGKVYRTADVSRILSVPADSIQGRDISTDFAIPADTVCRAVWKEPFPNVCNPDAMCTSKDLLGAVSSVHSIAYEWEDVEKAKDLLEFDGHVIRIPKDDLFKSDKANMIMRTMRDKDSTRAFARLGRTGRRVMRCLVENYKIGDLSKQTVGCFSFTLIQIIAMVAIGTLIIVRFILAVTFSWFLSHQLDKMRKKKKKASHSRAASLASRNVVIKAFPEVVMSTLNTVFGISTLSEFAQESLLPVGDTSDDPYVILLVTCYSEGEASLRLTLDSLALTDYHDHRKLIMVVADGEIMGAGNSQSTPNIVRKLMKIDSVMEAAVPQSYVAVADGVKRHNMAKVFAGQYHCRGRVVPCILIAKCGPPEESTSSKPGNRGKRDSQLIVMNFMQRVIFNDRMTPLDFELFNKVCWLLGVPPDALDIILMVDADTKVAVDSLGRMVNAMRRDPYVMGLCGETRIANKRSSWVSAIQVFEYYISHHLGKAFESVFGGVTCLPGCFCMYRIKTSKNGRILPILASPALIEEYSQAVVDTLHKKNLLLLGEDRFLTTLMLKLFPKRKMIFVPQAFCKTFVPDEFRVLLSQRRRWINSTIHNLLELVLVPDLCGIFCFSMQFVVLMELIGTVVLPAAIIFTFVLIGTAVLNPLQALIPLILLGMVLGLPAILILITTRKMVYIGWMLAYLLALPIWNFILPIYAYWHFDDFSWGETRKIEATDNGHGQDSGSGEPGKVVTMKTWIGWSRYYEAIKKQRSTATN
ncbi:Fungal chitin synthase domain-containing protein [Paramicrosporidium saccamoebae]|uniref:chitin synthase n=1 Tax=Paramicrosporidium saccamoebae TaxID=1246581 RepID=A0A2H9TNM4_9FUNG|nr:Fungal chitin synthase domain-containing protein [Paramicrosporidium saccamoebae]